MLLKLTVYVVPAKNRENSNWVLSSCLETASSSRAHNLSPCLGEGGQDAAVAPVSWLQPTPQLSLLLPFNCFPSSLPPSFPSSFPSFFPAFLLSWLSACLPTFIYSWEHLIWVCFQCKMLIFLTLKGSHTTARQVMFKSFTFQVDSMSYELVPSTLNILLCVTVRWPFIDLHEHFWFLIVASNCKAASTPTLFLNC